MIHKSIKYRLYPTKEQAVLLNKHIDACRFVYNLALETKIMAYASAQINLSCFDLINQLPSLKKECPFLKEVNSLSLQASIRNLDNAFTNFFKGQAEFPKFKSKHKSRKSFKVLQNINLLNNAIKIPKFKEPIKAVIHRTIEGDIKSGTISVSSTGKYFISVLIETYSEPPVKPNITDISTVGVDLGIKYFATLSTGENINNPKHLKKTLSRLKFIQRKYSKHKGIRTKHKLAILHERVANQRKDFLHKTSIELIKNHESIAIEDLNVSGMIKNHRLAQSIQDVAWGEFERQLTYKAEWHGRNILQIGRFEPSSRMSDCGKVNKELKLSDRIWTCKNCGRTYDRDIQAAKNIKKFALRNYVSGIDTKNRDELPTLVGVMTHEANILN